jgi:hypothetical protein
VENQVSFEDIKQLFRETDRKIARIIAVLLNSEGFEPRAW